MSLTYQNYVLSSNIYASPSINADPATVTATDLSTTVIPAYEAAVATYIDMWEGAILSRDNIVQRFSYDALVANGYSTVDYNANTYTANIKADDYFAEASRNQNLTSTSGLATTESNLIRLYTLLQDEAGGELLSSLLTTDTLAPVTYDAFALTVSGGTPAELNGDWIVVVPNATGTSRKWYRYDVSQAISHNIAYNLNEGKFELRVGNTVEGELLYQFASTDIVDLTLTLTEAMAVAPSSSSEESSSSEG